jgi:hypothetical protein
MHGKHNHPHPLWGTTPVPFMQALHASFSSKIESLDQELSRSRGQSVTLQEEDVAQKHAHTYETGQLEKERSAYEIQLEKLLEEKVGLPHENPIGRAARIRLVPVWLYIVALIVLAIGEFFVTLPAVAVVLNDDGLKGIVITSSFASLSIIVAHLIGLSCKTQVDRINPQPRLQILGSVVLAAFLTIVILFLSAVRSDSIAAVPFNFGLSDRVFGTVLFFVIQMTFVLSAIALSYFNHSELDVQLNRSRRKIAKLTARIQRLEKLRLVPGRSNMTSEKRAIQSHSVLANMRLLEAQYREICAEYRGSNLRAQSEAMAATGGGLDESPLTIPHDRFSKDLLNQDDNRKRGEGERE